MIVAVAEWDSLPALSKYLYDLQVGFLSLAVCVRRGRGNRSNEIPPSPALGQLKEQVGFLVSRSLTLPATQPNEPQALFDEFHCTKKNSTT